MNIVLCETKGPGEEQPADTSEREIWTGGIAYQAEAQRTQHADLQALGRLRLSSGAGRCKRKIFLGWC